MKSHTAGDPVQIGDGQFGDFIGTGAGVVEESQEGIISLSLAGGSIRSLQEGVHLLFFPERDEAIRALAKRHGADLRGPFPIFGAPLGDKVCEGMQGSQTLVLSARTAVAALFQIGQKAPDSCRGEVEEGEGLDRTSATLRSCRQSES